MKSRKIQFKLNVPPDLKARLDKSAKVWGWSSNREAIYRLSASFLNKPRIRVKMGRAVV